MASPGPPSEPPTTSAATENTANKTGITTTKPCTNCRRRKVRCDKNEPCANCRRSGAQCVYEGTVRNDEVSLLGNTAATTELCDRLSRLESLIERMAHMNVRDASASQRGGMAIEAPASGLLTAPRSETNEPAQLMGRTVFDARTSVYVDPSAWSELFERVEGLRFWLSYPPSPLPPARPTQHPFIFSFGPDTSPADGEHSPTIKQSDLICKIFFRIVEPFIKVLHRPSFAKDLEQYRRQALEDQTEFEALLFAVHALTIAVLPTDIVRKTFGEDKNAMLGNFQREVEKAFALANILKSRSELCLQAFLYYLTLLFETGQYDEASSLSGLAIRLAHRLGLQHEPSHFNFSPWQAEMRRRSWNYVVHLDFRALTLSATESAVPTPSDREPQWPRNLDDNDWEPCRFARKGPEQVLVKGFKETTFATIRRQFSNLFKRIAQTDISFENAQELIRQARDDVQQKYLDNFSAGHPLHELTAALIRQQFSFLDIVSRHMYMKHQKRTTRSGSATNIYPTSAPRPNTFRHNLFLACLVHLEETSRIEAVYSRYKWQWIIRDPVPWHAIARLLTDLCHWFEGPEVERAWKQIQLIWLRYGEENGNLVNSPIFQPLRSMREQAQFALQKHREGEGQSEFDDGESSVAVLSTHPTDPAHLTTTPHLLSPDILTVTTSYSPEYAMQDLNSVPGQDPYVFDRTAHYVSSASSAGVSAQEVEYLDLPFENVPIEGGTSGYWSPDGAQGDCSGGGSSGHTT